MKPCRPVLFLLLSAAAALCQQNSSTAPPATAGTPRVRGAQAFTDYGCPQCHTIHSRGGTKGPDLSDVGHRLKEEQIRTQILKGGKQMPSFGEIIPAAEADDLVAYLYSLREDEKTKK